MIEPTKNQEKTNQFAEMEKNIITFWQKAQIFEKSIEKKAPKGDYTFYDGPPFATGTPHYGHIVASIMKDVVPRYWTMNGYRVERTWGWDCHGLPIENIIEKELGINSKKEIEEVIGIEKFNQACRAKVLVYADEWKKVITRLGRWVDMDNAYKTMDLDYMESIWWSFKQLWDKDLIYQGNRSIHLCPRCETTLSQSEVAEGYKDIKDLSCIAKFELVDELGTFILAWTTTPWTLIGNVALAIGKEIDYVKIESTNDQGNNEKLILAKDRLANILKDKQFKILSEFKGADLIGKKYKPLFNYYANDEKLENRANGWKIYPADFVTTTDGTGVVHIAPAFGEDDLNLGKANNLPFVQHVGTDGNFKPEVLDFSGLNVKPKDDHTKTDIEIIKYLAHNNLLFAKEKYEHSYPHCWRCDTPLINYATTSWYVAVTKIKDQALELAKNINWSPEHIKEGRFGNWLEGARDWSISRQRFWASVMPIWQCEKCGELEVFGSIKELEDKCNQKITDLHKDTVDKITYSCSKCQATMKRIPDVLDCWFESGSMPYAQLHYPFENKEKVEKNFPAEFIAEGADQTRCWFYYLHVISTGIKQSHAYKNVIVNGIVLAEDGKKMSKKLKNYPDPMLVLDKYSADALRAYLIASPVMQAENLNFSEKGVEESLRKNIMILWNVYKFYEMYAGEGVQQYALTVGAYRDTPTQNILDIWIIARLNQLIKEVTEAMNNYNLVKAMRPITDFINDLSTWYLRRSRDRFHSDDEIDKNNAIATTGYVFEQLAKVMAPFMPFVAENLWQKVSGNNFQDENKSVHLEEWPISEKINNKILEEMEKIKKVAELGLAERDKAGIKIRQILNQITIVNLQLSTEYENLVKDELNIKTINYKKDDSNEIKVELDTEITPELKLEGIKREIIRSINMMRKDANLTVKDEIIIEYETEAEQIIKAITDQIDEICKNTVSKKISKGIGGEGIIKKEIKIDNNKLVLNIKQ